jgi:3-methyladenine DNA glycosylase AlkD
MEILGVSAPNMRTVLRELHGELKNRPPGKILEMVSLLIGTGTHEARQVAYELLDRRKDARAALGPQEVRALGKGMDNWASVDAFCAYVAGPAWREGQLEDSEILAWSSSKDRWWRRAALVATVPLNMKSRGGSGDPERTIMVCRELTGDPEPMVVKGLSWALRALVPVAPDQVAAFLEEHDPDLPALVRREVRNKLETGKKNPRKP